MIGKSRNGKGFSGCFRYVMGEREPEKKAHVIGGNMMGRNSRELSSEVRPFRQQRPDIEKPVWHMPIAFHPDEKLSDAQMQKASELFLSKMGVDTARHQYLLVRHHDEPQPHVHIVVNRISTDGKVLDLWRDRRRVKASTRAVEKELGLRPTIEKDDRSKDALRQTIRQTAQQHHTMPEFAQALKTQGITAQFSYRNGQINGITYSQGSFKTFGSKLGKEYSFQGLQRHLGMTYLKDRDESRLATNHLTPSKATPDTKTYMRSQISEVAQKQRSFSEFCEELDKRGIKAEVGYRRDRPSKLSYSYEGQRISGKQLGSEYTFKGLQSQGITYDPQRDDQRLQPFAKQGRNQDQGPGQSSQLRKISPEVQAQRDELKQSIQQTAQQHKTMPEFAQALKEQGITPRFTTGKDGKLQGISYQQNGKETAGYLLSQEQTFNGLQKQGISYNPQRDDQRLKEFAKKRSQRSQDGPELAPVNPQQQSAVEMNQALSQSAQEQQRPSLSRGQENAIASVERLTTDHDRQQQRSSPSKGQESVIAFTEHATAEHDQQQQRPAPSQQQAEPTPEQIRIAKLAERVARSEKATEQRPVERLPEVAPGERQFYRGEEYTIERVGLSNGGYQTTIADKQGGVVFVEERDASRKRTILSDQSHQQVGFDTGQHRRNHREILDKADELTFNRDIGKIQRDPTGMQQSERLGELAPEGSRAIATAHLKLQDSKRDQVSDKAFVYKRTSEGYEVSRKATGKVIARSDRHGIKGQLNQRESEIFRQSYTDLAQQAKQAKALEQNTRTYGQLAEAAKTGQKTPYTSHRARVAATSQALSESRSARPLDMAGGGVEYRGEDYTIEKSGNQGRILDKQGNELFKYSVERDGSFRIQQDSISTNQKQLGEFEKAHGATTSKKDLDAILQDPSGNRQNQQLGGLAPEGSRAIARADQELGTARERRDGEYLYQRTDEGIRIYSQDQLVARSDRNGVEGARGYEFNYTQGSQQQTQEPQQQAAPAKAPDLNGQIPAPETRTARVYEAEKYTLSKVDDIGSVRDRETGELLLQYRDHGNRQYEILHDSLTTDRSKNQDFMKAAEATKDKDLGNIMRDNTGRQQVKDLGNLAPQGSHAIALAHEKLDGREKTFDRSYNYQRAAEGYQVSSRETHQLVAESNREGIQGHQQKTQDLAHFQETLQERTREQTREKELSKGGIER